MAIATDKSVAIIATKWLLPPDRWHEEPQTDYWHRLHIVATKCYHWPVHLQDNDRHDLESTRNLSCNLWIPDWVINNWQLAMTLGSRGQLHVSTPTCLFTCFKISSSKFYITLHIFRFVQSIWHSKFIEVFSKHLHDIFPGWYRSITWCLTHKNKCVIYLTVGDIVGYFHCIGCINM